MTGIEIIALAGLLWSIATEVFDDPPEPAPDRCYVVVSESPYVAAWVNKDELKSGICDLPPEMARKPE